MKVKSFVAWTGEVATPPDLPRGWRSMSVGNIQVRFLPRRDDDAGVQPEMLIVNSDADFDSNAPDKSLGYGIPVRFDMRTGTVVALTSIVGLPPLFLLRNGTTTAIASDIHAFVSAIGQRLSLDAASVRQLGHIGYPARGRTLFRGARRGIQHS